MDDLKKQLKTHFDDIAPSEEFLQKLDQLEAPKKSARRRILLPIAAMLAVALLAGGLWQYSQRATAPAAVKSPVQHTAPVKAPEVPRLDTPAKAKPKPEASAKEAGEPFEPEIAWPPRAPEGFPGTQQPSEPKSPEVPAKPQESETPSNPQEPEVPLRPQEPDDEPTIPVDPPKPEGPVIGDPDPMEEGGNGGEGEDDPLLPPAVPEDDPDIHAESAGETKKLIHASYADGIVTLRASSGETAQIDLSGSFNGTSYYGVHTAFGKSVALTLFELDGTIIVFANFL